MADPVYRADARRDADAATIALSAGQWLHITLREERGAFEVGTRFYGIPSSKGDGSIYYTNFRYCSCRDYANRGQGCKHQRAALIHARAKRQQQTEAGPSQEDGPTPAPLTDGDAESILLARLLAEQSEHGKKLKLLGYERSEYTDDPTYAQRAHHIERLQSRRVASVAPFALTVAE